MPCLLVIFALATPRLVIAVLWFFTTWFKGLFDTPLWPILGFVFLPTSFLWFTAVQRWFGGQWTLWPIVGLVIALMIDISPASGRRQKRCAVRGGSTPSSQNGDPNEILADRSVRWYCRAFPAAGGAE